MNTSGSLIFVKLYGESDAAIIFLNFNCLATGIWDLKSQSQKNMDLLYSKWPHRTHKVNKKKLQHSRLQSGREICKKHSKIPQPNQTAWCWQFIVNFSARLQSWVLECWRSIQFFWHLYWHKCIDFHMTSVPTVICHISSNMSYDSIDIWHMTVILFANIGVKRTVWTSGM